MAEKYSMMTDWQTRPAGNRSSRKLLVAAFATGMLACQASPAPAEDQQPIWPAEGIEDFSLTECSGRTITKADLLGQPWLASFIFTHCIGPCPRVSEQMQLLQDKTRGTGIRLVTFTVDPARDTPEVLRAYADYYKAEPDRWWFLTGDKEAIFRLIRGSFKMMVADQPHASYGAEVAHSTRIMHVNATGRVVGMYDAQVDVDMARLRRVLGKADKGDADLISHQEAAALGEIKAINDAIEKADEEARFEGLPGWIKRLPAINASLNGLAGALLLLGLALIRAGKPEAHKATMLSAFFTSALFLACYLVYHTALHVYVGSGSRKYAGNVPTVYYTILISHILLAFVVAVMAPITLYRGLKGQWKQHRRVARVTYPIWLYVSLTGVIIYVMLYQ